MGIIINSLSLSATASALLDGHVGYGFRANSPSLDCAPADITQLDCSGFTRYLLYQATGKQIMLPDGSSNQESWCKSYKLAKVAYSTAASHDAWLRIAFIEASSGNPGHVWFVHNGLTLESHSGTGPDQRSWNTPVLKQGVSALLQDGTDVPPQVGANHYSGTKKLGWRALIAMNWLATA